MSRVHDMGGRFGDGPIPIPGADEPVFETEWHARALAVTLAAGALGKWNIDISRHARECLSPKDYSRFTYYEKWMGGLADLLVDGGVVTREELAGAAPQPAPKELQERRLRAERVAAVLAAGGPANRDGATPEFAIGDKVRTRRIARNTMVEGGHTRLPAYAAGVEGEIILSHGCHVLPDAAAHRLGEQPEPLYTVVFDAGDLWGEPERAGDEVTCDLWQSYLEPVT
ncbi:nitrile hydratase subunit beta [Tropicibacter sp. R15_0]|uniref:nitrile hydratase subunit beta n=1 Tax=Tropicibacter sp. R15_0 TaxID=2821101 RepID=UPI001ADB869E|nr:nitrile hydratase subunit beta [Tropicibacter sp. R15_0]MBO9465022.1 nitrile hydratase subunit beta [Tropicibacter sp. R15_0]